MSIRWNVAEESNLKEYQIQRSTTGNNYVTIGIVTPETAKSIYSFSDMNFVSSTVYYRIKTVDLDGKVKYSSIVRLKGNNNNSFANVLKLYPIPAKNDLTVEHGQLAAKAKIIISSTDGKVVKIIYPSSGASHTPINLSGTKSGIYILSLNDGKGKIENLRFIKQ